MKLVQICVGMNCKCVHIHTVSFKNTKYDKNTRNK